MRGERGAATVELSLLLPMLLAIAGGVLTLGMGFATQALLQRGAEAAARTAAIPVSASLRTYPDQAAITAAARDAAVVLPGLTVDPVSCDRSPCGAGAGLEVTARYEWANTAGRLLGALSGNGADATYEFTATVRRVRE